MRYLNIISWLALSGSLALFALVVFQASALGEAASARAERAADQEQILDRSLQMQRVSSIIADTGDERARLENFMRHDVVSLVEMLEGVGKSARVVVAVDGANTNDGTELPGGERMQVVTFSVNASGSYQALMHALDLYEHLPIAIQIEQFNIEEREGRIWELTLRIRIMILAPSV